MASVDSTKQRIRESVWKRLQDSGAALFPGAHGRIPNFRGATEAAERLAATPEWRRARTIKCNPDAPQRPVRLRALRDGKLLFMAVPKLRALRCFWKLDPHKIPKGDYRKAATIGGAARFGAALEPGALPHVDLIVAGCVAVNPRGTRLGKGGGYSDLEYAIGREVGTVDEQTVVATTVHPLQLIEDDLPETAHDFRVDLIVTPEQAIRPKGRRTQPAGILRAHLTKELRGSVPVLRRLGF